MATTAEAEVLKARLIAHLRTMDSSELAIHMASRQSLTSVLQNAMRDLAMALGFTLAWVAGVGVGIVEKQLRGNVIGKIQTTCLSGQDDLLVETSVASRDLGP